jgi:hypothetical protein
METSRPARACNFCGVESPRADNLPVRLKTGFMDEAMSANNGQRADGCPHLNSDDPRCASRLCLSRLDQAFTVCFGAFHACPMFHRINGELSRHAEESSDSGPEPALPDAGLPPIRLTIQAQAVALRPTGT